VGLIKLMRALKNNRYGELFEQANMGVIFEKVIAVFEVKEKY
jgi:hypothetical protein